MIGLFVSNTLAGSITINSTPSEFGQGRLLITNCDSTIYAQPIATGTGSTPAFLLSGFTFWGIDVESCENREFTLKLYDSSSEVNILPDVNQVRVSLIGGLFTSNTTGITIVSSSSPGTFTLNIDSPTLDANVLKKVTLDSDDRDS